MTNLFIIEYLLYCALTTFFSNTDPKQYIEEGTQRAIEISSAPGVFSPALTEVELLAIRLPHGMVSEAYIRNRDFEAAVARLNEIMPAIHAFIEECKLKIAEAESQGVNVDIYRKRKGGRGEAKFLTKVVQSQRVTLNWNEFGIPVGPGIWGTRFNEAIGCLVRRTDMWDVAFTFKKHGHASFKQTWQELLVSSNKLYYLRYFIYYLILIRINTLAYFLVAILCVGGRRYG